MSLIPEEKVLTPVEEAGKASIDASGTFGASWRTVLFRAIRDGDVPLIIRVVSSHPTSIHENFTNGMQEWELSWDSLRWYEFADATALYLASAYCRVEVVKFLLSNGVDPDAVCYTKQIAADVIGQCRYSQMEAMEIDKLLKAPRKPPAAPVKPNISTKIGYENKMKTVYEEIVNPEDPDGPKLRRPKRVSVTVVRCKLVCEYKTYWLPPKTHFELRCRVVKSSEWRIERTQATNKVISQLLPDSEYEVQVRAKNVAGWSDFSELVIVRTPAGKDGKGADWEEEEDNEGDKSKE